MPPTLQVKLRRFSRKLVVHCDSGVAPYCKLLSMEKAGEGVVTRLKEMGQYPRQGSANVLNGPLYCPSDFRMWTVAKGSRKLPSIDFSGRNNAPLLASVVLIVPGVDNSGRICTSSLVGMEPHQWGGGGICGWSSTPRAGQRQAKAPAVLHFMDTELSVPMQDLLPLPCVTFPGRIIVTHCASADQ